MFDVLCIALMVAFFGLAVLFVHGLERLARDEEDPS